MLTFGPPMAIRTVLLDLGGTLIDFFGNGTAAQMIPPSLLSVREELFGRSSAAPSLPDLEERWAHQKRDPQDLMARPLEDRLSYVFRIDPQDGVAIEGACRAFMRPTFDRARLFEDALPFLKVLRARDLRTILVSNTTWGSPAHLWRKELARHGLAPFLDATVFCRDVGWRKPHPLIFEHAMAQADALAADCIFVGDDPVWDVEGSARKGMTSVLLDRRMEWVGQQYDRITCLNDIIERGMLDR
jgi:putative hydrolase of the HAD superfamily